MYRLTRINVKELSKLTGKSEEWLFKLYGPELDKYGFLYVVIESVALLEKDLVGE